MATLGRRLKSLVGVKGKAHWDLKMQRVQVAMQEYISIPVSKLISDSDKKVLWSSDSNTTAQLNALKSMYTFPGSSDTDAADTTSANPAGGRKRKTGRNTKNNKKTVRRPTRK